MERYSSRPLPAAPYLPGVSPRTARPPAQPEPLATELDDLAASETFRHGIDLFDHGFPWEAHEAWEALWFAMPRERAERTLLQGLIHVAAAAVKARSGKPDVARDFIASAREYLTRASAQVIDVPALLHGLSAWMGDLGASPPIVRLA